MNAFAAGSKISLFESSYGSSSCTLDRDRSPSNARGDHLRKEAPNMGLFLFVGIWTSDIKIG
jgi:hypothetical protein